ncbi:MAG TPA: hypothetical protein VMX13_09150 [Sedimentisphaerales bacterium]|nr:hypothetical protein [Sedimentisphaerales bacterium]
MTCKNCEYFVQVSSERGRYAWGRCLNPTTADTDEQGHLRGVFQWADGSCLDFKPRSPVS